MSTSRLVVTTLAFTLALGAFLAPAPASNSSSSVPRIEQRPIVAGLVGDLQDELAHRSNDETRAKELVEKLATEFTVSGSKDRGVIVKVLERCLAAKQSGKPDAGLVCHATRALAAMAPESLPVLNRALDNKLLLKEPEIGRTLVLALGKTRDKGSIKELFGVLDHPDDALVAAAGEALGEYDSVELATRKQIFEEVLKTLMQAKDQKDAQAQQSTDPTAPHDDAAARRYDTIQAALSTTLQRLSKQEPRSADLWQRWWNKNKRANWDDKSKLG